MWHCHGRNDFFCRQRRIVFIFGFRQKNYKFVATLSANRVAISNAINEPVRNRFQQQIASSMAERVVDVLEIVQIKKQYRQFRVISFCA